MRKIRCYECGRRYDFDVDDFCPKCGAFNQPGKSVRIGADGAVVSMRRIMPAPLSIRSSTRKTGCGRQWGCPRGLSAEQKRRSPFPSGRRTGRKSRKALPSTLYGSL